MTDVANAFLARVRTKDIDRATSLPVVYSLSSLSRSVKAPVTPGLM